MQTIALGNSGVHSSVLGFGCAAMMGRVGRKASLNALAAAFDSGITFYDTARSYGYGESEALLGEFLHRRRSSVLVATKFGILPAPLSPLKRALKPVARTLLHLAPGARRAMQSKLAAQSSAGHFSVAALHASLHASLRALRTDYVDFLFLHEAPTSVLEQDDLLAALEQLIAAGKVRCAGIASSPAMIEAALAANLSMVQSVQLPCNLAQISFTTCAVAARMNLALFGNHPFGGSRGIARVTALLRALAVDAATPKDLSEKLLAPIESLLADVVLNTIVQSTPVQVVIPSMLQLHHLRANVAAIESSRFTTDDLTFLRNAIATAETTKATPTA